MYFLAKLLSLVSIITNSLTQETTLLLKLNDNLISNNDCDYNLLFILGQNNDTQTQNLSNIANENGIPTIRLTQTPKYSVRTTILT